ncbi:hypothetical protein QT979_17890 [Microcoleus sp. w2-18bC1]|uniref:hypothetical protein n=1 Tax=unclassified Microcoleus TaxID=2642155 RepID=UPI002FD55EAA
MKYIKFQRIALTAALIGATTAGFNSTVMAQTLESTKTLTGRIDDSSNPVFISGKSRPGIEYSFQAVAGDDIQITGVTQQGSAIDIVLMVYPPDQPSIGPIDLDLNGGTKEVFSQNSIDTGGTWKVRVVSYNDQPGNYSITLLVKRNGAVVGPQQQLSSADQVLKKHDLISTACSTPDVVAVIDIGGEKRCVRNWVGGPGEWVYNQDKDEITRKQPADPYIATINSWRATLVDCNAVTAVVRIAFEATKVYCIQPTSAVPAGNYTYDRTTGEILPQNAVSPPIYTPGPVNTPPDEGPIF